MALPSRVLNSGVTSLTTAAICGEGASAVSAAGTTSSDATALTSIYNRISTVAAGAGVKLPPCEMGATIWVTNVGANALLVYPWDTGTTIGGATSLTIAPNSAVCFFAVSNTRWEQHQGFGGTAAQAAHGAFISTATQTAAGRPRATSYPSALLRRASSARRPGSTISSSASSSTRLRLRRLRATSGIASTGSTSPTARRRSP